MRSRLDSRLDSLREAVRRMMQEKHRLAIIIALILILMAVTGCTTVACTSPDAKNPCVGVSKESRVILNNPVELSVIPIITYRF